MAFEPAQVRFLEALAKGAMTTDAAAAAGVARQEAERWRQDPAFAAAWADAAEAGVDVLEAEARRRAVEGTLKPVFHGGKEVGEVREYSDTLLMFLLRSRRRSVFGDKHDGGGAAGGALRIEDGGARSNRDVARAVVALLGKAEAEGTEPGDGE